MEKRSAQRVCHIREKKYYTLTEACRLFGIVPQDYKPCLKAANSRTVREGVQAETIMVTGKRAQTA
jgi:hypothetical protein